jgi:hypothetical protein
VVSDAVFPADTDEITAELVRFLEQGSEPQSDAEGRQEEGEPRRQQ